MCKFGSTNAGGIHGHQQNPVERKHGRVDEACDFFLAQDDGEVHHLLGIGSLRRIPWSVESFDIEETQRGEPLVHRIRGKLFFGEEVGLEVPDVFRAQFVGRAVEIAGEIFNGLYLTVFGSLRVVSALEFLEHHPS